MASPQRRQRKRPSQPLRTVSKALRTLGTSEDIQCTKTLVEAYNADNAGDATGIALHHWLEAYVDEFSKRKAECMPDNWIREYAFLATIKVKTSADAELLGRVYGSLRACIKTGEYCSPVVVVALDSMLRVMDTKIVEKETQSLTSLANDLLRLTDPEEYAFTRDTYPVLMACLLTLERILIVLHGVERARSKQWIVDFFQSKLKKHLKGIEAKEKYYPFVYNVQLIKHNIDGLLKGNPTALLVNGGRRAFFALCGGLYLFQGIRELAVMRLDFASMEAGVQKMHQAICGMLDTKAPGLQEVVRAASKAERTNNFSHIMECYKKHERPSFMDSVSLKNLKIVKFALVSHLTLFASESARSDLSDHAFSLLSKLAVNDDTKQWRADSDIYESLLNALASTGAKRLPLRHDCLQLLHQMEKSSIQNQQTVKDWHGEYSIEQKLNMISDDNAELPHRSLYDTVRKRMDLHLTHKLNLDQRQVLVEHYQDKSFTEVSLFDYDEKKRHIVNFDFHIVMYGLVDFEKRFTKNVSTTDGDQIAHNLERSQWAQAPIELRDIFARRRQKPSGPKEDVNRILLLGNPGTGKTSLSKRICYDWTTGEWGPQFDRVYLLPIRQLTGSRLPLERTVEGAIAILLFDAERELGEERKALHRQIKDELAEKTTLLVMDGLDEAHGNDVAEVIVRDALSRSCNILVLSRPHNLGQLGSKMDIQIECLGLSDDQLKAYVRKEVPDAPEELIKFLNKSPVVWETAKVPVNAQILCTLWNSDGGQSLKESKSVSLKSLYSSMTEYAWQRFVEKSREQVDHGSLFSSLEIIAFKSIRKSKVEIPFDLVIKHTQSTTTRQLLLDSGFLLFQKEGQVFQFAHLSFHEFFADRFLAKQLRGTEREIMRAKQYIKERKYCETSRVTMSFMTQCYCQEEEDDAEEDCVESLKQLLAILNENPVEVIGFQHVLLKMRTLEAFLPVCENCVEEIFPHDDLHGVVQSALVTFSGWLPYPIEADVGHVDYQGIFDQIVADLGQMPNLFAHFPELLSTMLKLMSITLTHSDYDSDHRTLGRLGRLVSFAPEQLLQVVPTELQVDDSDDDYNIDLYSWFQLFRYSGPEGAVLALERLKADCRNQSEKIRETAYKAAIDFLKVLPGREDLHSLLCDAMKDTSASVRASFMEGVKFSGHDLDPVADDLTWTLTLDARWDDDEEVRRTVYEFVHFVHDSIPDGSEEMLELLQEFTSKDSDRADDVRLRVTRRVCKLLRDSRTTITVFLPYLANFCNDPSDKVREEVVEGIQQISSWLEIPQKRELVETILTIYHTVQDHEVRKGLVSVLSEIGRMIPDFISEFPDAFLECCMDTDNEVRELAKAGKIVTTSLDSVDKINEVFWDQSIGVKKEILRLIQQKGVIGTENAEVAMAMAVDCLECGNDETVSVCLLLLLSLTQFCSLSNTALCSVLNIAVRDQFPESWGITFGQPLDRLLDYFWDTTDKRVTRSIAGKLMTASLSYETIRRGKSRVSIVERGKRTVQEAPTKVVKKLIRRVKKKFIAMYGDFVC